MRRAFIESSLRDTIIGLWRDGLNPNQIVAAIEGVSLHSVTTIIRSYKKDLLGRKSPHDEAIVALARAGKRPSYIAVVLGLAQTTVRNHLHAHRLMNGDMQEACAAPPPISLNRRKAGISERNYQIWFEYTVEKRPGTVLAEQYNLSPARVYQILQDIVSYFTMLEALPPDAITETEVHLLSMYKTQSPR